MALQIPNSMKECVYFTRRATPEIGKVIAWVGRQQCPKCKKGTMGKPWNAEGQKYRVRAKEYLCNTCGHVEEKATYEDKLTCSIMYTCPKCNTSGETQAPFKRKTWNGVPAIVYQCDKCNTKLGVTKKMKAVKKKSTEELDDDF